MQIWHEPTGPEEALARAEQFVRQALLQSHPKAVLESGSNKVLLSRSIDPDFCFRITVFDETGPSGHVEYLDDEQAIQEMVSDIADALRCGMVQPAPRLL